jgi:outer membrane translocation and assembly module TamA
VKQRDLADFDYMVHSAGFGLRYKTPVGPIRVDLAYGPNAPRFFGFEGSREDLLRGVGITLKEQRVNRFQFFFSLGQTF